MKKYATIISLSGEKVTITLKGTTEEELLVKLSGYKYKEVLSFSDKPPEVDRAEKVQTTTNKTYQKSRQRARLIC